MIIVLPYITIIVIIFIKIPPFLVLTSYLACVHIVVLFLNKGILVLVELTHYILRFGKQNDWLTG